MIGLGSDKNILEFIIGPESDHGANTFLIINISNSNNLNKFLVGIFTRQGHINQVY